MIHHSIKSMVRTFSCHLRTSTHKACTQMTRASKTLLAQLARLSHHWPAASSQASCCTPGIRAILPGSTVRAWGFKLPSTSPQPWHTLNPSHHFTTSATASLRQRLESVLSLHAGALWARHKRKVYAATAVASVWLVWRITYMVGTSFISVTTTMAEWGFMALAVAVVAAGFQYARWYWGVNPAAVYRRAMFLLNSSPAVLEVMGAPLVGSELRAYIATGGNLYMSRKHALKPKISSQRLQMIFPLRGSERDGLASVEVKRKQGRYVFKLLAVDVRPADNKQPPARVFVEGTQSVYEKGSALGELRDPFLKAVSIQQRVDKEEELEEELEDLAETAKKDVENGFFGRFWATVASAAAATKAKGTSAASAAPSGTKIVTDEVSAAATGGAASADTGAAGTSGAAAAPGTSTGSAATTKTPPPPAGSPRSTATKSTQPPVAETASHTAGSTEVPPSNNSGGFSFRTLLFGPSKSP